MDKQQNNNIAQNSYEMTLADYEKSRLMAILEGISARIIFGLTTGAFLTGYLKFLGADDDICGQIAAIPVLAGIIQFFSPMFLEKLDRRKPIVTAGNALHRILLVLMVIIPLLPVSVEMRLYITGGLYLLSHLMVNMVAPATTTLFISLVPQNMRGRFFSIRERYLIFISSVVNVVFGGVLDKYELSGRTYEGYILMFAIAFMAMLLNLFSYLSMKEPRIRQTKSRISLKQLFTMPLKEKRFRKIIILFFLWGLSMNFSNPFFSVYMVSKLRLSYTFITICGLVNSIMYVITVSIWGKVADKKSFTYTAMISIALLGATHMLWFFAAEGAILTYAVVMLGHITGGIAWAGIGISLYNIPYEYTPEEGRTVYLGFNAALSGLIGFVSSMLASYMVGAMSEYKGIFAGLTVTQFQLIFLISGFFILVTSFYIRSSIIKPGKKRNTV